jgi:flavin-dependent dehydrogenase
VGADGPRSRIARAAGLGVNRLFLVGMEAHLTGVRGVDPRCLHCFLDSRRAPGYIAWAVPGVHGIQIGLACRQPHRPDLRGLLHHLAGLFDFRGAREVSRRGGLIPIGGPVRPLASDRVLLVGDAAGLVSPLTAGGIHTALASGRLAGHAVADHLQFGEAEPERILEHEVPRFHAKRLLRSLFDLRPPNGLYDAVLSSRTFRALAATLFFHHRGLLSRAAWKEVATVLFRAA